MANRRTTRMQNKRKLEQLDNQIEGMLDIIATTGEIYAERYPEITEMFKAAFAGLVLVQELLQETNKRI